MSVLVMGMSHHTAPVDLLERAALSTDDVAKTLDEVHGAEHVSEAVVVATCNRLELYADVATFHGGVDEVGSLLATRTGVPLDDLTPHLYVHYQDSAVSHLFHVASGLDAMVVGESQILGQVREAFRLAQTSGATGRVLTELFQGALRAGKRAHAETDIDLAGRSLVTVGLGQVLPRLNAVGEPDVTDERDGSWDDLIEGKTVLIVGAGAMAALAATTAARAGANAVVANRTYERAVRLADSVGGRAVTSANLPDAIANADVLISCTGASDIVLPAETIAAAVAGRTSPLGVLDLALPRDVEPAVADIPGVVLADLTALASSIAPNAGPTHDSRGGGDVDREVAAVRAIVADELSAFAGARRAAQVAPTVVALRSMADEVVAAELTRLTGRIPDVDDRTRSEIVATVRRVVDKLLHSPTVRVKELASRPDGASYEAALRELFALERGAIDAVTMPDQGDRGEQ